ncbi:MAG: hypothetical protein MMC23_005880 [Stictis urceolatum]|nr:hypothetical protein [Stictis urceolata]
MSSPSTGDGYRLMRDASASIRLNAQHYLWKQICGFNIHPQIPLPKEKELKVADIGVGTAIWMADVKLEYPALKVDGFDKSLQQCPPDELLPEGCSSRTLDILADLPEDVKGLYDIVNVTLLQGGLEDTPVPALRNMLAMLKPGGYLQWQEVNLSALSVTSKKPGLEQSAMKAVLEAVQRFNIGKWTPRLADICAETGFLDCKTDRYPVSPDIAIAFAQTQLGAYEEISRGGMDNGSQDAEGPRLRETIAKAHAELRTGVWLKQELEVTVARKQG